MHFLIYFNIMDLFSVVLIRIIFGFEVKNKKIRFVFGKMFCRLILGKLLILKTKKT